MLNVVEGFIKQKVKIWLNFRLLEQIYLDNVHSIVKLLDRFVIVEANSRARKSSILRFNTIPLLSCI